MAKVVQSCVFPPGIKQIHHLELQEYQCETGNKIGMIVVFCPIDVNLCRV